MKRDLQARLEKLEAATPERSKKITKTRHFFIAPDGTCVGHLDRELNRPCTVPADWVQPDPTGERFPHIRASVDAYEAKLKEN